MQQNKGSAKAINQAKSDRGPAHVSQKFSKHTFLAIRFEKPLQKVTTSEITVSMRKQQMKEVKEIQMQMLRIVYTLRTSTCHFHTTKIVDITNGVWC